MIGGAFLQVERRVSSRGGGAEWERRVRGVVDVAPVYVRMADLLDLQDSAPRSEAAGEAEMLQSTAVSL